MRGDAQDIVLDMEDSVLYREGDENISPPTLTGMAWAMQKLDTRCLNFSDMRPDSAWRLCKEFQHGHGMNMRRFTIFFERLWAKAAKRAKVS